MSEDKQRLLEKGGYLIASNVVMRRIMPAILEQQRNGQLKDAFLLYFYLLSYVDGREIFSTGKPNPRYGYAYPSIDKIAKDTRISRRRIKPLCDMLTEWGLLETKIAMHHGRRKKLYKPIYNPKTAEAVDDNELDAVYEWDDERDY